MGSFETGSSRSADFLVVGGGVVGLAIARELKQHYPDQSVLLIEKESACGQHASSRNSGVLHAGFYYSPDSLKAKFCREGNRYWTEFCCERQLPINACGKLVVAQSEAEVPRLRALYERGLKNEVAVEWIDSQAMAQLEPLAASVGGNALWSPSTATVDPAAVLAALLADCRDRGVEIATATAFVGRQGEQVLTSQGAIAAGFVVNAAGLYADRVAAAYGVGGDYRILPFKGLYLYPDGATLPLRRHIYPVPEPDMPFLGVHWTVTVNGIAKIGPTAIPALWRQQYGWRGIRWGELADIALRLGKMFFGGGPTFRRLVARELRKYSRRHLAWQAWRLLQNAPAVPYRTWGAPGIRAQLLNLKTGAMEMDFVVENGPRSLHVLNAVSPAFTCAVPFARHVVATIEKAPAQHAA